MRCGRNYWHAVAFTFSATFKRAINRPKSDHFFSQIYLSIDKRLSFQGKKITNYFSIVQGSAGEKTYKLLSIRDFTLLIRANNYETDGSKPKISFCSFPLHDPFNGQAIKALPPPPSGLIVIYFFIFLFSL